MPVESHGNASRVRVRWRGVISLSQTCAKKEEALDIDQALLKLHRSKHGDALLAWLDDHKEALPNAVVLTDDNAPKKIEHLTIADLAGVSSPDPHTLVAGRAYDDWMEYMATGENRRGSDYAPSTIDGYRFVWKKFFRYLPLGRSTRVSDITAEKLVAYRKWLLTNPKLPPEPAAEGEPERPPSKKRRITKAGANRHIMAIRAWHTWLRDIVRGPGLKMEPLEVRFGGEQRNEKRAILPKDWQKLCAALRAQSESGAACWIDVVVFLHETGLRAQEAQQLTYAEIRSDKALAVVSHEARRLKTSQSARHVPLSSKAHDILARYRRRGGRPSEPVFPKDLRNKWGLQSAWVRARRTVGVSARLHDLRHTRAVLWLIAEGDIHKVSKWLGHKHIATTEGYTTARENYELALGLRQSTRSKRRARPRRAKRARS